MNTSPETMTNEVVPVLSVSPVADDHFALQGILNQQLSRQDASRIFKVNPCATLAGALVALRERQFEIVICECDLEPGSWKDVLDEALILPVPPSLIVTSRLADERLWAEVLNLGAYDVLVKPLNAAKRYAC